MPISRLLATRLRTEDMLRGAPYFARMLPGLLSLEAWGGATFDVALRFLKEDPWERLAALRDAVPNICLQMLIRGRNTVGYTPYPDEVAVAFVKEAARTGVDIFRVFDALNDVDQMLPAIKGILETGKVAEGAVCYTGDLASPSERLYTLDYYLRKAEQLVTAGVHVLCIKDMAGLLRAPGRTDSCQRPPGEFRTAGPPSHPRHRGRPTCYLPGRHRSGGRRNRRGFGPLAGSTSQPSLGAIVAATDNTAQGDGAFPGCDRGFRALLGSGAPAVQAF